MHPILVETPSFLLRSYPTFVFLALVIGGALFVRDVLRRGWSAETLLLIAAGCLAGAFVGSRLLMVLFIPWQDIPRRVLSLDFSGKTIVGGLAGGYGGVELVKALLKHRQPTGDAFAVAVPLGAAIGRIGCLAEGCCFGVPTALPWGLRFPAGSPAWLAQAAAGQVGAESLASLPVHPTQVYEALFDVALFVSLRLLRDRLRKPGSLFRLYLLLYGTFRFFVEFLRGDSLPVAGGLKIIQYALIPATLLMGFLFWRDELRPVRGAALQGGSS